MVSQKTKILTEGRFWFANFTKNCSKWSAKRQINPRIANSNPGYVPECFKTQEMCDKAVDIHLSVIQFVPEYFKTKVVCNKAFPKDYFMLKYGLIFYHH